MLRHLHIKNFTLIDTLDIDFRPGFSVITGETGAGKSIILGAVDLLLGRRASARPIKDGKDRCVVEARFGIAGYGLEKFFDDNDIDYDTDECVMRRELTAAGKSRAFINDTPVPLTTMRALGGQLVDIHSQHQNLLLNEEDFQLKVVDIIARDKSLKDEYAGAYGEYMAKRKAAEQLQEQISRSRENEDYMRFQASELDSAGLAPGIQEKLEQERDTLSHVEEIKTALFAANDILSGNGGVTVRLKEATRLLNGIKDICPDAADASERMESCRIELNDISRGISAEADGIDYDPRRLEELNSRLDTIYALQRKHHAANVETLMELRDDIKRQLSQMERGDEELRRMKEATAAALERCQATADKLTIARRKAAADIREEMRGRLAPLGIPNVRFTTEIGKKQLSPDGQDSVAFLFSANTSTPMLPVSQVASGGEVARVMLSIKAMISGAVNLPTIIFDEIDTGVSGKTAERMADIMREIGENKRQVISITHLPQIAASGSTHYKVFKEETPQGTTTRMKQLAEEERVGEIAQMLSGADVTAAAVSNARELLRRKKRDNAEKQPEQIPQ